jgi:hypothetical protein
MPGSIDSCRKRSCSMDLSDRHSLIARAATLGRTDICGREAGRAAAVKRSIGSRHVRSSLFSLKLLSAHPAQRATTAFDSSAAEPVLSRTSSSPRRTIGLTPARGRSRSEASSARAPAMPSSLRGWRIVVSVGSQ